MKMYDHIILLQDNNYIGYFVRHYLENNAVSDAMNVTDGDSPLQDELPELLVIADPRCKASTITSALCRKRAKRVVLLSSTDIYDACAGENLNELTPLRSDSESFKAEQAAKDACDKNSMELTILRLPELVVGTGMDGMLMKIVTQISRGTYSHIKGSDARRSVVHASSIGKAVAESVPGIFNIADPEAPTVRELAEAISFRIGQKRIYSMSYNLARRLTGMAKVLNVGGWKEDMLEFKTNSLTFSTGKAESAFNFSTTPAVEYLRTHIYDESSL